jgi:hypothetical protein
VFARIHDDEIAQGPSMEMHHMTKAVVPLLLGILVLPAGAIEEHLIQGNYGAGKLDGKEVTARVVAQGNGAFIIDFLFDKEKAIRCEAQSPNKMAYPAFEGKSDTYHYRFAGSLSEERLKVVFTPFHPEKSETMVEMKRVYNKPPTLGADPPQDAIVLLDGSNLDEWYTRPEKWHLHANGDIEVANPDLITHREFGDHKLHIEFQTPFMPHERGQARGNSGVYIHGVYEVQVLDSFGLPPADNDCGGIYKIATPTMNACLPPLEWQTYDITFRAPRFDADGKKTENARITVVHNGHTIHDDIEIPGLTGGALRDYEAPKGPLKLQHHHDPVHYQNIWVEPLD